MLVRFVTVDVKILQGKFSEGQKMVQNLGVGLIIRRN